jgi:thiol-disulfide isomerase/thioredoxin
MTKSKPKATQKQPHQGDAKRKIPVLGIAFVGVAALLIAAVVFTGEGTSEAGEQIGTPVISGDSLPQFPNSPPDPAAGLLAPEVVGTNYSDEQVEINHDGTPTAIVFLAHWCSHCQAEVPRVTEWLDETGGVEGVDIISVATAMDEGQPNYPPETWLSREDWPVPVIRDDANSTVWGAYGNGGFPYWVFLDGEGRVVARTAGELQIDQLEALLAALAGS